MTRTETLPFKNELGVGRMRTMFSAVRLSNGRETRVIKSQVRRLLFILGILGLTLAMASPAFGDSIVTFYLNTDEAGCGTGGNPACGPTNVIQVTVDLISSGANKGDALVTFSDTAGYVIANAFFNTNGANSISEVTSGYTVHTDQATDGFGPMTYNLSGGTNQTSMSFLLTPINGNVWSTASQVMQATCPGGTSCGYLVTGGGYNSGAYSQGFDAAVALTTQSGQQLAGYVPEPASLVLLVSGLLALAVARRLARRWESLLGLEGLSALRTRN